MTAAVTVLAVATTLLAGATAAATHLAVHYRRETGRLRRQLNRQHEHRFVVPGGILTVPGHISAEQAEQFRRAFITNIRQFRRAFITNISGSTGTQENAEHHANQEHLP